MEPLESVVAQIKQEVIRRSEDVLPWQSFWYYRPTKNFPPPAIQDPRELSAESDRLSLACTQTELSAAKQKALVREWCHLLPTLHGLKYIWFQSRVTQELFDAACSLADLEGLYVKWSGITSIDAIRGLKVLKALHFGSSPSLEGLAALHDLHALEWLELENIRATRDLSFLRGMPQLRGLSIRGDSNSLKDIAIDTLAPLSALQNLEWLALSTMKVTNDSLVPISKLQRLKYLHIANKFRMEQIATLAGQMSQVSCDLFSPISEPLNWGACKTCKQLRRVMLTGKGKPFLCLECDRKRIEKHVADFKRIAASARTAT